ncbi:MAG: hypothetical protein WA655_10415 [Candidatus Korobacteraceae bacterium]
METQVFTFANSPFVPVAIGFFGLGTGYFIWGGQALFGFPKTNLEVNRTMGMWGFWMPGFMQFITGVYLLIGLTWFKVFGNASPLYMAGLAFTAYGIHWFAMAHRRYIGSSDQPDAWMAIAFLFISLLGVDVFRRAGDIPVMDQQRMRDGVPRRAIGILLLGFGHDVQVSANGGIPVTVTVGVHPVLLCLEDSGLYKLGTELILRIETGAVVIWFEKNCGVLGLAAIHHDF